MQDCKPVSTPLDPGSRLSTSMSPQNAVEASWMHTIPYISVVGSLMYLAITTRPRYCLCAGVLARFNSNPGPSHWQAASMFCAIWRAQWATKITLPAIDYLEPFITYSDADHGAILTMASLLEDMWSKLGLERFHESKLQGLVLVYHWSGAHCSRRGRQGDPLDASVYGGVGLWDLWAITASEWQSVCDSVNRTRAPWQMSCYSRV